MQLTRDDIHLRSRRFERDAGFEPCDDAEIVVGAIAIAVAGNEPERAPVIGVAIGKEEVGRHHPDDDRRCIVKRHGPAEHVNVAAKAVAPQPIADHDGVLIRIDVGLGERAPDHRLAAEQVKHSARDALAGHALRFTVTEQCRRGGAVRLDTFERPGKPLPIEVIRRRRLDARIAT